VWPLLVVVLLCLVVVAVGGAVVGVVGPLLPLLLLVGLHHAGEVVLGDPHHKLHQVLAVLQISLQANIMTSRNNYFFGVFTRASDPDPHWIRIFWRPWIRIRISNADLDPDPRLIIQLEIQKIKIQNKTFF